MKDWRKADRLFGLRVYWLGPTCRGFHLWPRIYPGVNGVATSLLCWLWWSWEVAP